MSNQAGRPADPGSSSLRRVWGRRLAIATAFAAVGLAGRPLDRQAEESSHRAYRVLIHLIFVLMVVFFLFGDRIVWINGLSGIAWRSWLGLYCLPAWFALIRAGDTQM